MADIRSTILGSARVRRETTEIQLSGADVTVEVRGITAGARGRLLNGTRSESGTLDFVRYYAQLVIETAYVPGTDTPVFLATDLEAVNDLPAPVVQQLAELAESLSAMSAERQEELSGNSGATPNVATDSSSLSGSA